MEIQTQDVIYYKGNVYFLNSDPMESYGDRPDLPPDFTPVSTSIHKGFTTIWSIVQERLFIISLSGFRDEVEIVELEQVFPGCSGPVFATWFTGLLTLQSGRIVAHFYEGHIYEREEILSVEKGLVTGKRSFKRNWTPGWDLESILFRKVGEWDELKLELIQKLSDVGVVYIGDLITLDAFKLMQKAQLSLSETEGIVNFLADLGLTLGMHIPDWPPKTFDQRLRSEELAQCLQLIEI